MTVSPLEAGGGCVVCGSFLQELSTSPGSFFGCCCWSNGVAFSSLLLFWSDGVEGLEEEAVGGTATDMSSENIDMSCSSSSLSKPLVSGILLVALEFLQSSTKEGGSRKAMESLIERRWAPRRTEEKSRNSSTQEGWLLWLLIVMAVAAVAALPTLLLLVVVLEIKDIRWWGKEGQLWAVILGIFGGKCAIRQQIKCVYYKWHDKKGGKNKNYLNCLNRTRRSGGSKSKTSWKHSLAADWCPYKAEEKRERERIKTKTWNHG